MPRSPVPESRPDAPILVINLGWEQRRLVEAAFASGRPVVGVHADAGEVPDLPFAHVEIAGPRDLGAILRLARRVRPGAVVADQCDYSHFAMAMVCEEHGLPGPRVRDAQLGCNKHLSRAHGDGRLRAPRWVLCSDLDAARSARRLLGGAVIVKPVDNRGSFGVSLVEEDAGLPAAVSKAIEHAHSRQFLVEEFIEGQAIIIEGYFFASGYRSLVLGGKTHLEGRPQIHMDAAFQGDVPPVDVAPVDAEASRGRAFEAAMRYNEHVARVMGFDHGMTSAEYILDEKGEPWLVEIANRGGGVCISSLIVPWVSGIDTTRQLVLDALDEGHDLAAEATGPQRAAFLSYFVLEPGELAGLTGLDEVRQAEGLLEMRYWGPRSGPIEWPEDALGRQGMLIVGADTVEQARSRAARARDMVRAEYV